MDFSFSIGGGAGTSIFNGVITKGRGTSTRSLVVFQHHPTPMGERSHGRCMLRRCVWGYRRCRRELELLIHQPVSALPILDLHVLHALRCRDGGSCTSQTSRRPFEVHGFCSRIFIGFFWSWFEPAGSELVGGGRLVDEARGAWCAWCGCARGRWH